MYEKSFGTRARALTILAGVLWGTSFPMIKIGLDFVDPYMFVFLRMFLASVLIVLISFVTNNLSFSLAKERLVWYLGLLNGFAYLIQYIGMSTTTASYWHVNHDSIKILFARQPKCCMGRSLELGAS